MIPDSSTPGVLAGFLLGIPLMAVSFNAVYGYLGAMINLVLPMIISPLYVAVYFVAVMLTYRLSKALCAKKVDAVPMSEALKAGTITNWFFSFFLW